jgi:poly-gamma-glutamate synthesis protein (capsule biosynthesis protein)
MNRRAFGSAILVGIAMVAALGLAVRGQNLQSGQVFGEPPAPPRDAARELAMKITAPFTVAAVGDVMIKRPASMRSEPAFQNAIKILRDADIAVGNMEGNLSDLPNFEGPLRGMMGSRDVAPDLKAMGFDLMNRANNHIFDSDKEGMLATIEQLDKAGIVHAGTGSNLEDARAPAYLDMPKGRVAIVGMHTPHNTAASNASYQTGNVGGRPGLNALNYEVFHHVTAEQLEALKRIRAAVYTPPPGTSNTVRLPADQTADRVQLFGIWYKVGTPGTKSFEMNRGDLREILRSIRNGKTLSNFLVATIHAHQGPITAQQWLFEDQTPDFLIELAHQAIDNGADAFVGHGPHVLRGIEIYKGKPIFYGLGEFFYQWQHMDASIMSGSWAQPPGGRGAPPVPEPTEQASDVRASAGWRQVNFESAIALSRFDQGRLVEVRLYPMDGGFSGPLSDLGIPRMAAPDVSQRILQRLQALSKPFRTTIAIEGNVGVIRVSAAPSATSAAAGGQGRQ